MPAMPTGIDYLGYAHNLIIVPVHEKSPENTSGYLTPRENYEGYTPFTERAEVIHATVGLDTLPYFAHKVDSNWNIVKQAGAVRDGRNVLAQQLIPRDDYTIYDMVPAGFGCGHCNPGSLRGVGTLNFNSRGYELENLQNGYAGQSFTLSQYIKLALTIAYHTAVARVPNQRIGTHFDASMGAIREAAARNDPVLTLQRAKNAHIDPFAGPFDEALFYKHLAGVRADERVFALWRIDYWDGE